MPERDALTIRLGDGRQLGYADYGDPAGMPVMFFHGSGDCRLLCDYMDGAAASEGIRLIAPDRPGVGLSDFAEGRSILSWANDVNQLLDALSIDRFVVAGGGGGAVYALGCARELPDRVRACVITSCAPPRIEEMLEDRVERLGIRLIRVAPWLAPRIFGARATKIRSAPDETWSRRLAANHGDDLEFYGQPGRQQSWQAMQLEAYRRGPRGVAQEINLLARPWGFELGEIKAKVLMWQGEESVLLAQSARRIAASLPDCEASFVPNGGMVWTLAHPDEFFRGVVAARVRLSR